MRILLIRPRDRVRYPRIMTRLFSIHEIGLLLIAGAIKDLADIIYIDENHKTLPDNINSDLVFINVQTHTAPRAYEIAKYYRGHRKKVILGGPHVSLNSKEALQYADTIVTGPGEKVVRKLISDFKMGSLKTIYEGYEWHSYFSSPYYDLINNSTIINFMPVIVSRGCQHKCSHCVISNMNRGMVSTRNTERIISDINNIKTRYFFFVDDNLLANRETLLEVLRYLAKSPKCFHWAAQITSQVIYDKEIMELLKPSGCKLLFIGFDSLQKHSLHYINSFKTTESMINTVEELHSHDISIFGSFMFGLDGDKPGDIIKTSEAAIEVGLDLVAFNLFTPIPGTKIYHKYMSEGRIFENNLLYYDFKNVVFYPKYFSPQELLNEFCSATSLFYSVKGLSKRISKIKNRTFMLPINLLYNPHLSKLLHINWRNESSHKTEQTNSSENPLKINLAN